jgi:hypothetical protein
MWTHTALELGKPLIFIQNQSSRSRVSRSTLRDCIHSERQGLPGVRSPYKRFCRLLHEWNPPNEMRKVAFPEDVLCIRDLKYMPWPFWLNSLSSKDFV